MELKIKKYFTSLILLFSVISLYAKPLRYKGYPTSIQINNKNSFYLMINNDYDFSFYTINVNNGLLESNPINNLKKSDLQNNINDFISANEKQAIKDNFLQKIIQNELKKEEIKINHNNNVVITLYVSYTFYKKIDDKIYCIFNFEDGNYIYPSQLLYFENSNWKCRKLSKENIIYFSELGNNQFICIKYNFKKDMTTVILLDDIKKLK